VVVTVVVNLVIYSWRLEHAATVTQLNGQSPPYTTPTLLGSQDKKKAACLHYTLASSKNCTS